jgi:DNA-binding response OmpR family regulator
MSDKKILVIDDDPDILESITTILKSENFTVITAYDGAEGLEKFKSEKPALVICDMMMERVDAGSKVAEAIRKDDKETPVYLLSSIGDATYSTTEIGKLGFSGALQKPVDPKVLISEIKQALKL